MKKIFIVVLLIYGSILVQAQPNIILNYNDVHIGRIVMLGSKFNVKSSSFLVGDEEQLVKPKVDWEVSEILSVGIGVRLK